jgi:alginate O-acetyltransferase complex protein AlgI
MLFNSLQFIFLFFPIVVLGFYLIGQYSREGAVLWLCSASLYFFCQWNVHYLWLLLLSITVNYGFGYGIAHLSKAKARAVLVTALGFNLLLLGYYKYAGFFAETMHQAFGATWSLGQIIMPLGISFFTFTQIAFLVDSYRGKVKEHNFYHYILFVTYFPHLIAGPILHHTQMMPQFRLKDTYRINWENNAKGLMMFIIGFAKKILLADYFATIATPIFELANSGITPLMGESWMGVFAYSLQLYFDFSGYCDMAIGISLFLNIRLPFNFNSPYKSFDIIEFWRRWHMTLSAFLRDYLYIPLGGNRHGDARRYLNVLITMLIGGLWHGAGWTFVIWGGLHGGYLAVNHAFRDIRHGRVTKNTNQDTTIQRTNFKSTVRWIEPLLSSGITFLAVSIAWVFFRSPDLSTAFCMLGGMIGKNSPTCHQHAHLEIYWPIYTGLLAVWLLPNSQQWVGLEEVDSKKAAAQKESPNLSLRWNPSCWWNWLIPGVILAVCILALTNGKPSEFLYFQF